MNHRKHCLSYLILIVISFSLTSCHLLSDKHCINMPQQIPGGTGEIISNTIVKIQRDTIDLSSSPKEDMVITSDSLNLVVSFDGGAFNPVDFSQYSVLGKYADGDGCSVFYDRNVTKDTKKKKYIYTIRVISCGDCALGDYSTNWVLIPKIEEGFSVEFVVEHERWKRK